jgi:hypothetical protein
MTDERWLAGRIDHAPPQLREAMLAAVADIEADLELHDRLAEAAARCLQRAVRAQIHRECALDLLTADALLTHAAEAAAEAGSDTLAAFAAEWNAQRFDSILQSATP